MAATDPSLVPSEDDIIKILITSDNHVGYQEKDQIRGKV